MRMLVRGSGGVVARSLLLAGHPTTPAHHHHTLTATATTTTLPYAQGNSTTTNMTTATASALPPSAPVRSLHQSQSAKAVYNIASEDEFKTKVWHVSTSSGVLFDGEIIVFNGKKKYVSLTLTQEIKGSTVCPRPKRSHRMRECDR